MTNMVPRRTRTRPNSDKQYGIDMANVLDTKSDLKTAKLRQEGLENELAIEEATDLEHGNFLAKDDPDSKVEPRDENEDGKIDETEIQNARRDTGRKWNAKREQEKLTEGRTDKDLDRKYAKNRDGRAGGRYNMAKEKHDRWKSENKKSDERIAGMWKVEVDANLRLGHDLPTSEALASAELAGVTGYTKKVNVMITTKQEQAIAIVGNIERQMHTVGKERDPKKQTAMLAEGKTKAEGDLRVAKATGTLENIELAEDNLERFNRLTDENGNEDPKKIATEYKKVLLTHDKLKKQYGEAESKKEMTALQSEKLKMQKEKVDYTKKRDIKKDKDKKTKTEKDLAEKNKKAVDKAKSDKAKKLTKLHERTEKNMYSAEKKKELRAQEERAHKILKENPDMDIYEIERRAKVGEDRSAYKEGDKLYKVVDGVKYEADKKRKKWVEVK